jgi:membrane associated rhomboid family serine protease
MKYEWKVTGGASLFLGLTALVYWFLSYEDAGTVMLIFSFAAYGMLGAFLLMQWFRRARIPRPEDNPDATHEDGAGEVAFFPAASIWPAGIGLGAIFIAVALIYGNWYWVIGLPLVIGAVIGFTVEAETGLDQIDALHARAEALHAEGDGAAGGEHPDGAHEAEHSEHHG